VNCLRENLDYTCSAQQHTKQPMHTFPEGHLGPHTARWLLFWRISRLRTENLGPHKKHLPLDKQNSQEVKGLSLTNTRSGEHHDLLCSPEEFDSVTHCSVIFDPRTIPQTAQGVILQELLKDELTLVASHSAAFRAAPPVLWSCHPVVAVVSDI
jgi:hypothetical protein